MPNYKLTYFKLRARGEPVRLMLALSGVSYEKEHFEFGSDEWNKTKCVFPKALDQVCRPAIRKQDDSKYPFNQLPVLEVDGTPIAHSMTILRYLGREYGYAPKSSLQQALADGIVDQCQDLTDYFIWLVFLEKDAKRKEKMKEKWKLIPTLKNFETILKRNGSGWFVGDKLTYADIAFFGFFDVYVAFGKSETPKELDNFPLAKALYERVKKEPKIAEYLKTRPDDLPI